MLAAVVLLFLSLVLQCEPSLSLLSPPLFMFLSSIFLLPPLFTPSCLGDQWRRVTGFTFPACPTCSSFTGERWHYSPFRRRKPVAKATATSSLRHWRDTSSSPSSSSSSSWRLFALPKDFDPYKGMDAYQILEVPRNADDAAIKKAFKKQIFKWHPDRVPREEEDRKEEHEIRTAKINHA